MTTKFYKNGDSMSIGTDAKDEDTFLDDCGRVLSALIDSGAHGGDWEFQFMYWLPQIVELCCKYRGYKSDVTEQCTLFAGSYVPPDIDLEATADVRGVTFARDMGHWTDGDGGQLPPPAQTSVASNGKAGS